MMRPGIPAPPLPGECRRIAEVVCATRQVALAEMFGHRGERRISDARMIALHLCVRHSARSISAIGQAYRRHHSTVIHADRTIHARAALDPALAEELQNIARAAGLLEGSAT